MKKERMKLTKTKREKKYVTYYIPSIILEDFEYVENNFFKIVDIGYTSEFKNLLVNDKLIDRYAKICVLTNKKPILKEQLDYLLQHVVKTGNVLEIDLMNELAEHINKEIIKSVGIPKKYFNK